jgi:hypothetical protein
MAEFYDEFSSYGDDAAASEAAASLAAEPFGTVNMRGCHFASASQVEIIAHAAASNTAVGEVRFPACGLDSEGARAIAAACRLADGHWSSLCVALNESIGDAGAAELASAAVERGVESLSAGAARARRL